MRKRDILSFLSLLLLAIPCSISFAQIGQSDEPKTKKFKVGAMLPLTGVVAEYGIAIKNCIKLAQQEHPELFTNIKDGETFAEDVN